MKAIPLTKQNISTVASSIGISPSDLVDEINKSKLEYIDEQNFKYILDFFNADEEWYRKTKAQIEKIRKTIPNDTDHKTRTIKMYGWIKNDTKISGSLSIPLETDQKYSEAHCIEMVFNGQIDIYKKITSWD